MPTALTVEDSRAGSNVQSDPSSEDWIIERAIALLEQRVFHDGPLLDRPQVVRDYLRLKLVAEPNEIFAAVFLNARHEAIAYEPLFKGTIDQSSVYPRVVVQRALALNAKALVLAHQHPSGSREPSPADRIITERLRTALDLVDVQLLDHFIIGKGTPYSFAKAGLL